MSFKSKKPPEVPQLPPQPKQEELMDVVDEVLGVKTTTVTDGTGRRYRKTTRLPMTEQEQKMLAKAEELMSKSLANIEELYKYDPDSVVDYRPFINTFAEINDERMDQLAQMGDFADIAQKVNDFKTIQSQMIDEDFDRAERQMESGHAYRGIEDSTAANERRAAFANQRALAQRRANVEAQLLGEDLTDKRIARENMVYDTHEKGRLSRMQQAQAEMELQRQMNAEKEAIRQQAISENLGFYDLGSKVKAAENDKVKLTLMGNQINNDLFGMMNANNNQRYKNLLDQQMGQYDMQLARHNSLKPSFGEKLVDVGLKAGGTWISAPGGGWDTAIGAFQNAGSNAQSQQLAPVVRRGANDGIVPNINRSSKNADVMRNMRI